MGNAIIVGASSGIGRALACVLARNGYGVGLTARRLGLLQELAAELPSPAWVRQMDVSDTESAMKGLSELIEEMGDVELFILNAGVGLSNWDLEWGPERDTIGVNVAGFAATANVAVQHLVKRGGGSLAGISSIAALRGDSESPAYGASKAFMSNYLGALRQKFARQDLSIVVTDVQPGYVDTDMLNAGNHFWMATPQKAAGQIFDAIRKRKKHIYVTRRWRLIAWLIRVLPDWIVHRL